MTSPTAPRAMSTLSRFRGPLFFSKTWTCKDVILYSTPKNPTQLQRAQRFSSRRRKNTPYIIVRVRYKPSSTRLSFFFSFCCGVRSKYKNNSTSPRDERAKQAAKVYTHTHTSFSHYRAVLDLTDDASHQRRLLQIAIVVVDVVTSIRDDSFLSFFGNGSYTSRRRYPRRRRCRWRHHHRSIDKNAARNKSYSTFWVFSSSFKALEREQTS